MAAQGDTQARFSDPGLLVLASLADGAKHGYAIVLDVQEMAGVHLGPGTLYGALSRLEEQGLIEPLPADGRRRPYRLTATGSRALAEQLRTIAAVADTGLSRLRAGRFGEASAASVSRSGRFGEASTASVSRLGGAPA
jgi:DNA-binding PadR family transcriptional regulator